MNQTQSPEGRRGIVCPQCGCRDLRTTNTEPLRGGRVRRRKTCRHCGRKVVTYEVPLITYAQTAK